jgi:starvation-inducible DNA-binding protein
MATAIHGTETAQTPVYIGISASDRAAIAEGLSQILADSYMLYLKTHNFHWNVTGPLFHPLHTLFEEQYNEMAMAVDAIAERIRAIGFLAPGTFMEFQNLSMIQEPTGVPEGQAMLVELVDGNEAISRRAKPLLKQASDAEDEPTVDLLTQRMKQHEQNAWMLRSQLT